MSSGAKAQDPNMRKIKILDVKIIQQLYRRENGVEILDQTRVFDGTGKIPLDETALDGYMPGVAPQTNK